MSLAEQSKSKSLFQLGQATAWISYCYRKTMLDYSRLENRNNRSDVLMDFVRRIEANSTGIRSLVETSIEGDSTPYLKLPIGLLLRACIVDSIQGLYLSTLSAEDCEESIRKFNQDYVLSLADRFEVYEDRFSKESVLTPMLRTIYGSSIEDAFPKYIDWSRIDHESKYFCIKKNKRESISSMAKAIKSVDQYKNLSSKLYGYYRKYSQYEHFSQMGHGDSLVPFDEDSPSIAKAYEYVSEAALEIVKSIGRPDVPLMEMSRAVKQIRELCNS